MVLLLCKFILKHWHNLSVTAPKDAMRKHHKKWNVVQSGHCTVVLLHLAEAAGRQHHGTVTLRLFNLGGCATSKCCTIIEAVGHIEQNKTQAIQSSNCGPLNPSHPGCSVSNRIGAKSLRLTQLTLISGSGWAEVAPNTNTTGWLHGFRPLIPAGFYQVGWTTHSRFAYMASTSRFGAAVQPADCQNWRKDSTRT